MAEGAAQTPFTVTATFPGGAPADTTVTLSFAGTAVKDTDYAVTPATPTITIASGQSSGTVTLQLTPVDDFMVEGDETIRITGTATDLNVGSTSIALTDNDMATDYDTDNDGLIDIDSAAKLNAIRWDLNGDGTADNAADNASYQAVGAFHVPATDQCDDPETTDTTETCTGLRADRGCRSERGPLQHWSGLGADRVVQCHLRRRRAHHLGAVHPAEQ